MQARVACSGRAPAGRAAWTAAPGLAVASGAAAGRAAATRRAAAAPAGAPPAGAADEALAAAAAAHGRALRAPGIARTPVGTLQWRSVDEDGSPGGGELPLSAGAFKALLRGSLAAARLGHGSLTTLHVALGLIAAAAPGGALGGLAGRHADAEAAVSVTIDGRPLPAALGAAASLLGTARGLDAVAWAPPSARAAAVLAGAEALRRERGHARLTTSHLLAALLAEGAASRGQPDWAGGLLAQLGLERNAAAAAAAAALASSGGGAHGEDGEPAAPVGFLHEAVMAELLRAVAPAPPASCWRHDHGGDRARLAPAAAEQRPRVTRRRAAMERMRLRPLVLLAAALLLGGWTGGPLRAAGQGLEASSEQLGAGEAATASEFEVFEDALSLAAQSTGGRGNGGRGGTNVGSTTFTDTDRLAALQRGVYYLAGAAKEFGTCAGLDVRSGPRREVVQRRSDCNAFVPPPRDQQECNTCVSQSVATAISMSAAATMQTDPRNWDASASSLFFCTAGGRSCKTGFDIQEQLHQAIDVAPQLIRPTSCLGTGSPLNDDDEQAGRTNWGPACSAAEAACADVSAAQPYLNCTYKSLSTFWQIQQHIRIHGSVVSRISVYDDWEVQFNASALDVDGEAWPPYRYNSSAKPAFGHAVVIVGYNNTDYTWLILNSWGGGRTPGQSRSSGVTRDGLVKVKMGLAGVGTPDQTFGVECAPPSGGKLDPHQVVPWQRPRPVELVDRGQILDLDAPCVQYRVAAGDTAASIAEAFGLDMRRFVKDNADVWGPPSNVSYALSSAIALSNATLAKVLNASEAALRRAGDPPPTVSCTYYDAAGAATQLTCDNSTGPAPCTRLGRGTVGCKLSYLDANVTAKLPPRTPVKVCGISQLSDPARFYAVAAFADPEVAQIRALLGIIKALVPRYEPPAKASSLSAWLCARDDDPGSGLGYLGGDMPGGGSVFLSVRSSYANPPCPNGTAIRTRSIYMDVESNGDARSPQVAFTPALLAPLLSLRGWLESFTMMSIEAGLPGMELPPQLGALSRLRSMQVESSCLVGTLPPTWLLGWRSMAELTVRSPSEGDYGLPPEPGCGITGTIPRAWFSSGAALKTLNLGNQQLSGSLDAYPFTAFKRLQDLTVRGNTFSGTLPPDWASMTLLQNLDVSDNRLQGTVPAVWANFGEAVRISLENNADLSGCLPFSERFRNPVAYGGTGITGGCGLDPSEAGQWGALNTTLRALLLPGAGASATAEFDALMVKLNPLGKWAPKELLYGTYVSVDHKIDQMPTLSVFLQSIGGVASVTGVRAEHDWGLNLTRLPTLVAQLPRLGWVQFDNLTLNTPSTPGHDPRDLVLPPDLATRAHAEFGALTVNNCGLRGTLPQWANWTTIRSLDFAENALTGPLPTEWKDFKSMTMLDVSGNDLEGSLPPEWGAAQVVPPGLRVMVNRNARLTGSVPVSWGRFRGDDDFGGQVYMFNTSITGCSPLASYVLNSTDGINFNVVPACSKSENDAVAALRAVLRSGASVEQRAANAAALASWSGRVTGDLPWNQRNAPPAYCKGWAGIMCDAANRVVRLDLAGLRLNLAPLTLQQLTTHIANLPALQTLVLAGLGLQGSLAAAAADIAALAELRTLNISANAGIAGALPAGLATATSLEVLDVSGCSLAGPLPKAFAMLQRLRTLRLAGNRGVNGTIPLAWGIMKALEELDATGCSLSGPLPVGWAKPTAAAAAARQALAGGGARASSAGAAGVRPAASGGPLMAGLRVLRLAGNNLTGGLPPGLTAFRQLTTIDVAGNRGLGGSLPEAWAYLANLQELRLSGCGLTGRLPFAWSALTDLRVLDVSDNALTGRLVPTYGALTQLQRLGLASNGFSGAVPRQWVPLRGCPAGAIDLRDSPCMGAGLSSSVLAAGLGGVVQLDSTPSARPCPATPPAAAGGR
ncbi:MSL1 [Scenedesmus sp. PABB004]|nr:MSL1 [Scenedesmus sp. PABB004]